MNKVLRVCAMTGALALIGPAVAFAGPPDHAGPPEHAGRPDQVGNPGEPSCGGQTVSALARDYNGIGNLARSEEMTVAELMGEVDAYCADEAEGGLVAQLLNPDGDDVSGGGVSGAEILQNARAFIGRVLR